MAQQYSGDRNTIGSYGFALNNLAEGLHRAYASGWITEKEAKREFRYYVKTIELNKQKVDFVAELREQADEIEASMEEDD